MTCHGPGRAAPGLLLGVALLLPACVAVTINVTFPQERIDSAAASIEDMVGGPPEPAARGKPAAPPPAAPAAPGQPRGARPGDAGWRAWLLPAAAEAQEAPQLKIRTPEVDAAIASRRARYPAVKAAREQGCVGENNRGFLEPREEADCPASVADLVRDENRDRLFLYRTIVEQNHMPPEDLARVQAGFARARRERGTPGIWLQDESGHWYRR